MNKRIILGLVLLMGFSLLGIIAVQFYWFNNSVNVRNELFDRSVNEAMNKAVRRMETGRDLKVIRSFASADSLNPAIPLNVAPPPPPPVPPVEFENMDVVVKRDTVHGTITLTTSKLTGHRKMGYVFMTSSRKNKKDKSADILTENHYGTLNDSNMKVQFTFNDTILGRKIKQLKTLSKQVQIEYNGWETGRHIDETALKLLLREELNDRAIPIDFELSVVGNDSVPKLANNSHSHLRWYKTNLFPDDIFRKKLELAVSFPDRDLFIGKKTTWLLGLSVIFTIIIFLTFVLSIYQIIRQKKISEMKSDFINNMTHEFKTPLATISIAVDSINNPKVITEPETVKSYTRIIKEENNRMNARVEQVLQMALLDSSEFTLEMKPLDFNELVQKVCDHFRIQFSTREGSLKVISEAKKPIVMADEAHLSAVLINLLDNANKYSPGKPDITVMTKNVPGKIVLFVEDKGIGMSPEIRHRIFEKFFRVTTGNIHNVKGFGLGLSYSKAIVLSHKGEIDVQSNPGEGSTFVITLPLHMLERSIETGSGTDQTP